MRQMRMKRAKEAEISFSVALESLPNTLRLIVCLAS